MVLMEISPTHFYEESFLSTRFKPGDRVIATADVVLEEEPHLVVAKAGTHGIIGKWISAQFDHADVLFEGYDFALYVPLKNLKKDD